jgi:hypothetical protein
MYFIEALHDGTPWFLLAVFALLVTVAMNEAGAGSGITHHPFLTGSADAPEIPRATLFEWSPTSVTLTTPRRRMPREPLTLEFKPRLLGHWGTTPAQNLINNEREAT